MTAGGSEWLLPAAKQAFEHRKEIASVWERIVTLMAGKQSSIAVTGVAGAGKTVLMDYLTGRAYKLGYEPPGQSPGVEKDRLNQNHKRLRFLVLPGQQSPERFDAVDDIFHDKKTVDGIVHVVCNGFSSVRSGVAADAMISSGVDTIQRFREHQLAKELDDLSELAAQIRVSARKNKSQKPPRWMIVAVTKVDLFYSNLRLAEHYYSHEASSRFSSILNELKLQIGSDNFSWEAVPVCSWLDNFVWNNDTQASQVGTVGRDHYISKFAKAVEGRCAT